MRKSIEFNELGNKIFAQRYAGPGETSYWQRCKAMSDQVSLAEKDEDREKYRKLFYTFLCSGDFVPGGRIVFGSGRGNQNLLNCYQISPEDSVESIGKLIADMYKISCGGGGIGFNFSNLRPKGDTVRNMDYAAPGSVSVMKMINEIGNHVRSGANRRTALIAILNVDHPDLLEFLNVKLDLGQLNNFNISVGITDKFIEAAESDLPWTFNFKGKKYFVFNVERVSKTGEREIIEIIGTSEEDVLGRASAYYRVGVEDKFENPVKQEYKAKDLWNRIWENSVKSGDPGIYNLSKANEYTTVSYFENLPAPNPCGEIPLPNYGNCCLGHVNLNNMVDEFGVFQWKDFAHTVRVGVRFLDNVLTINTYPIPETKDVGAQSRRIGLGLMGYHYALIKMNIKYGSDKCLEFTERLMTTMRNEAYLASIYLSREKGAFPKFEAKKFLATGFAKELPYRIRQAVRINGIRNAVILTLAPTGTVSLMFGVSSGIEPIFSPLYKRRWRETNVWREEFVMDPLLQEFIENKKGIENFVGAYDIEPKDHMAVQTVFQRFIDSAISKTINLPASAKAEDFSDEALEYIKELKGLTVYRAGSKGSEPLEALPLTKENIQKALGKTELSMDFCKLGDGSCGS